MEKHSFDRRLAEHLRQHEKTPRPEAWKRLEECLGRKEERRRIIPFWYYGVAASVAVLLLAGTWWWGHSDLDVQPQVAVKTHPKTPLTEQVLVPGPAKPVTPQIVLPETVSTPNQLAARPAKAPRTDQNKPARQVVKVEVPNENVGADTSAEVTVVEPSLNQVVPPIGLPTTPAIATTERQTLTVESPRSNSTLIVKLTGPDTESEAQVRKRSRARRIFNQLKNAKNGEQVDWKEVGFNPNAILARAEEKIERNTEKVNQSYRNLKEKTNF
ncbi:MAG: hypothetical protein LH606_02575 [Cytophagaceae bacterium]|nr:hypothetical protein [Cytophagaceae bacterium]